MRVDLHMRTGYSADASIRSPSTIKFPPASRPDWISSALPIIWIFCVRTARATTVDQTACARGYGESAVRQERRCWGVLAGMEIGQLHATPDADDFVRTHPFDMVIGSLHAMPNDLDIYFTTFPIWTATKFLHEYFDQLLLLEEHGGFDAGAH